jgi:hypothetical protein
MLRLPTRLLSPALALIALVLLLPALATAQPQRAAVRSPAECGFRANPASDSEGKAATHSEAKAATHSELKAATF